MSRAFVGAAVIIMVMTLLSRVVGFVRDMFLAHQFGVGLLADAYRYAFIIPNTLFLFIPGALNAVFLPILKGLLTDNKNILAQKLYHKMFTFLTLLYLLIAVLGILFSEEIVKVLSPSYDGEQLQLTTHLMQIMWPSAVFIAFIGLFQATLNAHQQFFVPTLSAVVNSIVIIAAYPLLVPHYGIYGVAIGTTCGFIAASITMLPSLFKTKYSFRLDLQWKTAEMRKIGERFIPIMLGSLVTQMTVFIEGFLASGLGDGKFSSLKYAFTVYQLPMAIFVGAFTLPILPYLVEYFNQGRINRMKSSITDAMQYLFILMIPTITAMVIIPEQLISLVFQWGADSEFDSEGVRLTSIALIFYSIGLFFLAARDLLTRAFYAIGNTVAPVIIAVVSIGMFVLASYLLIPYLDHGGIALGTSIGALCNMILLALVLRRKLGVFIFRPFWMTALKTTMASVIMGAALFAASGWTVGSNQWEQKGFIFVMIIVAVIIYTLFMLLFKEQKVIGLVKGLKQKFSLKRGV